MQHCSEKHVTSAAKKMYPTQEHVFIPPPPPISTTLSEKFLLYLSALEMDLVSRRRAVRRNREQWEDEQNQITTLASCEEQQRRWVKTWTGSLGRLPTTILSNWCDTPGETGGVDEGSGGGCQRTTARLRQANLRLQTSRIHISPHFTASAGWVFLVMRNLRRQGDLHRSIPRQTHCYWQTPAVSLKITFSKWFAQKCGRLLL